MTGKRFYIDSSGDLWDRQSNDLLMQDFGYCEAIYVNAILDLLNGFAEENKKLKQVNEMLQMDFAMTERSLIEENDQLKKEVESKERMTEKRFRIDEHMLEDSIENKFFYTRDKAYVHIANVLYNQMEKILKELSDE